MKGTGLFTAVFSACVAVAPVSGSSLKQLDVSTDGIFAVSGCPVVYDAADFDVVGNVVAMMRDDLAAVTGIAPEIMTGPLPLGRSAIVVGTLGRSALVDSLADAGAIPADSLRGAWERFVIRTVTTPDGAPLLVIAGSDRRGTAYGVTTLSRALGVDPWVWWADVPVKSNPDITVSADYLSDVPTVRYRGMFINDEDWSLLPWASATLDKAVGDIGPETYRRVCQLLLRLKGNMLAPAMHSSTGAFYSHAGSKEVADAYGVIITTSHCEPMLFNNATLSEWDPERDGEWDYTTNRDVIYGKFAARLDEACLYENIYTIGMRGVHDEAMSREKSVAERVEVLERIISDQRALLSGRLGHPAEEIPQIFVPYKETLDLYRKGLRLPDDVTIIWPDDNYGYMKSLSTPEERLRSGGSGVYYHTSYLGTPHDYLWLCTTPPAMMYHELRKAYLTGADRYWLLNVGDIKPAELDILTFFDMAWDFSAFTAGNVTSFQPDYLASVFGSRYLGDFREILDEYYRLAWIRKPEYMGWELEWDAPSLEQLQPTEFSFTNYRDAVKRLDDYARIAAGVNRILCELPDSLAVPFFEMVGYPVLASEMMNRKFLFAQLNGELAAAGEEGKANFAARQSEVAADSIESLNGRYNSLAGGKWSGFMTVPEGFCAKYQQRPALKLFPAVGEEDFRLSYNPADVDGIACVTLDLRQALPSGHLLEGIGYDGASLQLGEAVADGAPTVPFSYTLPLEGESVDSVTLHIFHLPFFPLHEGKGCKIGVSADGGEETVIEYLPVEWTRDWKFNVLRNSALSTVTLPLDKEKGAHILSLRGIDGGMVVQRVVVDRGGMKPGYVGPDREN